MNAHINNTTVRDNKLAILTSVLSTPTQRNALIFSGLIMFGHFLIIPFINPYMEFNMGYSKYHTPMIYLAGGVASFFSANLIGKLADTHGKLTVFSLSVICALPLVIGVTNMPTLPFYLILALFAGWFTASTGRGVTAQAMVSQVVSPEQRGSFQSFNSSVQQIGSGLAALASGYIVVKGEQGKIEHYDWVGYLSVAALTISLLLARQIFKTLDVK